MACGCAARCTDRLRADLSQVRHPGKSRDPVSVYLEYRLGNFPPWNPVVDWIAAPDHDMPGQSVRRHDVEVDVRAPAIS
jgi:hypothetical protein